MGDVKRQKRVDNPKDKTFKFRYDAETELQMESISQRTGKTKSDIIRDGIKIQYAEIKK